MNVFILFTDKSCKAEILQLHQDQGNQFAVCPEVMFVLSFYSYYHINLTGC